MSWCICFEERGLCKHVGRRYRGNEQIGILTRLSPEGIEGVLSALLVASLLLALRLFALSLLMALVRLFLARLLLCV